MFYLFSINEGMVKFPYIFWFRFILIKDKKEPVFLCCLNIERHHVVLLLLPSNNLLKIHTTSKMEMKHSETVRIDKRMLLLPSNIFIRFITFIAATNLLMLFLICSKMLQNMLNQITYCPWCSWVMGRKLYKFKQ